MSDAAPASTSTATLPPAAKRSRWRRWVLRAVVVLLLATVGNVGFVMVRWYLLGSTHWKIDPVKDGQWFQSTADETTSRYWVWCAHEQRGLTRFQWSAFGDRDRVQRLSGLSIADPIQNTPYWTVCHESTPASLVSLFAHCTEYSLGWPFRSLHSRWTLRFDNTEYRDSEIHPEDIQTTVSYGVLFRSLRPTDQFMRGSVLPTHILWPGMLANTLVWSAIVMLPWVLWRGFVMVRARRRIARGRCGQCGYDRRGIEAGAPCPECGRGLAV